MKTFLVKAMLMVSDIVGLNWVFRLVNAKKLRIVMYHGIADSELPTFYWTQLPLREFKLQMNILRESYTPISSESLTNDMSGGLNYPSNAVVVTFDDGYENLFRNAWEVLKEKKMPATIFVVTGLSETKAIIWTDVIYTMFIKYFDRDIDLSMHDLQIYPKCIDLDERIEAVEQLKTSLKSFPEEKRKAVIMHLLEKYPLREDEYFDELRLLSVGQIMELSKSREIQIASHSHNHPILSTLSPELQADEIEASVEALASWGIPKASIFAYPNGRPQDFDEDTTSILKSNGIAIAVTTVEGFNDAASDPYRLKRIAVGADTDTWEFKARLSGLYGFVSSILNVVVNVK